MMHADSAPDIIETADVEKEEVTTDDDIKKELASRWISQDEGFSGTSIIGSFSRFSDSINISLK